MILEALLCLAQAPVVPPPRVPERPEIFVRADKAYGHDWEYSGKHPLAEAIRRALPGQTIGVRGRVLESTQIGGGNPSWAKTARWETPIDVAIVGLTPGTTIGPCFLSDYQGGAGVGRIQFRNLRFEGNGVSLALIRTGFGTRVGTVEVYNCDFGSPHESYSGYGVKWNIRSHSQTSRWDIRDCNFGPAQEWDFYGDNLGARFPDWRWSWGDSYFIANSGWGNGRGGYQLVSRLSSGPRAAAGWLVFRDCVVQDNDGGAGGGSDYTFVGAERVWLEGCESLNSATGGVTFWGVQGGPNKTHLRDEFGQPDPEGRFYTGPVVISNLICDSPDSDRNALAVSGCAIVELGDFYIPAGKAISGAISGRLDQYGGGRPNGKVLWAPDAPLGLSRYPGWGPEGYRWGQLRFWDLKNQNQAFMSPQGVDRLYRARRDTR